MFNITVSHVRIHWIMETTPVQNGVHTLTQKFKVFVQKDKSIDIAWFKTGMQLAHSQTCL